MQKMQLRAARAILEWSQDELAQRSGVSLPTIKRMEPGIGPVTGRTDTVRKLRETLEAEGIRFLDRPHVGVVIHVATLVPSIVQGRRCVVIHSSPDEPAIAIPFEDALREAETYRKKGDHAWADRLEEAAHEAEALSPSGP